MFFVYKKKTFLLAGAMALLSQGALSASKEVSINEMVHANDVGMCRVLGDLCLEVLNPKVTRNYEYQKEDKKIVDRLSSLESDEVKSAYQEQHLEMSDQIVAVSAKTLGTQTGYAVGMKRNNVVLSQVSGVLDDIANKTFQQLVIKDSGGRLILPPVIDYADDNAVVSSDGKVFRSSSKNFIIRKNARFVLTPPTWRSYLVMDYKSPVLPPAGLLPKNENQRRIWNEGVKEGYKTGLLQSQRVMIYQLNSMARDISGMAQYHLLRAYNIVSEPIIEKKSYTVTGGGKAMAVNDQVLQIKITPQLQAGAEKWKSLPRIPEIEYLKIDGSDSLQIGTSVIGGWR